jgi:predicted alpha/beta-fold hydrolase
MSGTPSNSALTSINPLADRRVAFQPPWIFRNGHVQTLVGTYLFGRSDTNVDLPGATSVTGEVLLDDGDRLVFHDDCPMNWKPGDQVAVLLHGLAGSHKSPYMCRIARQLCQRGVRAIRLNWRGCGTGVSLARYPYHSGRSEDLLATINAIQSQCPDSPITVIGFSMGGNVALKLLGESEVNSSGHVRVARAIAVSPPIDLLTTIDYISTGLASVYDGYFAKTCIRNIRNRQQARPDAIVPENWFTRPPRSMREFDETFTAPICGFASAKDYYARCSAMQFLPAISTPTLIIAAQDDPVVPFSQYRNAVLSPSIQLLAPKHGGHIGFITHQGPGWLDQQIINWTLGEV